MEIHRSRKVKPFCTGSVADPVQGAEKSRKKQRSSENRSTIVGLVVSVHWGEAGILLTCASVANYSINA